jgi:phosphoglycolate phosphatase-like HAD superfamily hydrolase
VTSPKRSPPAAGQRPLKAPLGKTYPVRGILFDVGDTLVDEGKASSPDDPVLPGVRETLALLSPKYRLGILSNTAMATRGELGTVLLHLGLAQHFACITTSCDIGWRKPHPLIFEAGLSALGTGAPETVMVGNDLINDVAGAKAMGIRTVHLSWSPRYRRKPRAPPEEATLTIETWGELPAALLALEKLPFPLPTVTDDVGGVFDAL